MNESKLKKFEIKNLFNQHDVCIPLDRDINIFLGENGMGKTTILNCLYCVLSSNLENLSNVIFEEIILTLSDESKIEVRRIDVMAYNEEYVYDKPYRRRKINLNDILSEKELEEMRNIVVHDTVYSEQLQKYIYKLSEIYGMPLRLAMQEIERYILQLQGKNIKGDYKKIVEAKKTIKERIPQEILYFPTYRRIEEDITKLGIEIDSDKIKNQFIQFGMTDVEKAKDTILKTIKSIAINSFTRLTGVLLKQYLDNDLPNTEINSIDCEKLSIVLVRVGDEIDKKDKERIMELARSADIYNSENRYLLNLINQLIESYEQQRLYDDRVKKFENVCNSYLNGKSFKYDASNLELDIYKDNSQKPISFQNLSSGEKQVISIFSKLYLEDTKDCIILFDEPELSLSIKWQMRFLPDIMDSNKCINLITVTHSPFIFDNEYDSLACNMGTYITDRK